MKKLFGAFGLLALSVQPTLGDEIKPDLIIRPCNETDLLRLRSRSPALAERVRKTMAECIHLKFEDNSNGQKKHVSGYFILEPPQPILSEQQIDGLVGSSGLMPEFSLLGTWSRGATLFGVAYAIQNYPAPFRNNNYVVTGGFLDSSKPRMPLSKLEELVRVARAELLDRIEHPRLDGK